MKITKLIFFETFEIIHNHTRYKKIGFEAEFNDDESEIKKGLYKLQRHAEDFFYESKAAMEKQMGTHVVDEVPYSENHSLTKVANLIKQISTCQALKILESYKLIVRGDEDLQAAYDKRHKELSDIAFKYIQDTSNNNT